MFAPILHPTRSPPSSTVLLITSQHLRTLFFFLLLLYLYPLSLWTVLFLILLILALSKIVFSLSVTPISPSPMLPTLTHSMNQGLPPASMTPHHLLIHTQRRRHRTPWLSNSICDQANLIHYFHALLAYMTTINLGVASVALTLRTLITFSPLIITSRPFRHPELWNFTLTFLLSSKHLIFPQPTDPSSLHESKHSFRTQTFGRLDARYTI